GGSWGSTLSLYYAIKHPEKVQGLVLRGIFLCRQSEIAWFYQEGAHNIYADVWDDFIALIPVEERGEAAKSWSGWEAATSKLRFDPNLYKDFTADAKADTLARIECHYFINN